MDVLNVLNDIGQAIAWFYTGILNPVFWLFGNLFLAYTAVVLVLFVGAYFVIFDPRATTGGKLIFQFMLSLGGVVLLVFIGIFIDPAKDNTWAVMPDTVDWWRPVIRFVIYGFVAYAISSLAWLLIMRKWFPDRLKKASDLTLVQPRHPTEEIDIVNPQSSLEEAPSDT